MPWIRIDEKAMEHPKVAGLPGETFKLWVQGLSHCQKFLTDGRIDRISLRGLRSYSVKRAGELVAARLWAPAEDDGVTVHDYLQWNDSRAQVLKIREQAKERVRKLRGKGYADSNAVTARERDANASGDVSCSSNNPVVAIQGEGGAGGTRAREAFAGRVLRVPKFLDDDFVRQLNGQLFDLTALYVALDVRLAQTGEAWDLRWIREHFAEAAPKPERRQMTHGRPYTAEERTKAERVRRNSWMGKCGHEPRCETAGACIAAIINAWRAAEEQIA